MNIINNRLFPGSGTVLMGDETLTENTALLSKCFLANETNLYPEGMKVKDAFRWTREFYPDFDADYAGELSRLFELPVKKKAAPRRIEKRTIVIFRDGETRGIRRRPDTGLLAGLYELPGLEGHLSQEEVLEYSRSIGLAPLRIQPLGEARHIFSHVEWHMIGYQIQVDELEKSCSADMIFARAEEIQKRYPIPAAFEKYMRYII